MGRFGGQVLGGDRREKLGRAGGDGVMATWGELEKAGTKWRDLEEMTWGELEEFCVINPKTKQIPDDMEVSFVPMQSVSDTGAVQTDEVRKASEVKKGFTFFEEGDVLFAKITPCMENGKGGIARGLKNGVGFGSTEFHVLQPAPEKVSSEWLHIPFAPMDTQLQFTDFKEKVDKSKLTIQQSLDKLEILKKALMQQYFGVR